MEKWEIILNNRKRGNTMEKEKTVLEVCTDSIESAIAAQKGGADRIELCSNLIIGGTTPDTKMYRIIQNEAGIPARILIRPRFGDFCYSKYEKELILEQIQAFREEGAQGVVIGALLPDGSFDLDTLLTSGQEPSALAGANCLEALAAKAEGRIHILAGAGVSDAVIKPLYEKGIRHFHLSAKIELESAMKYRNTRVSMGLPGMSEYMIWQTDDKKVRSARMVLDACSGKEA